MCIRDRRRSERSGLDFAVLFSLLVSLEGVDHDVRAQNDQQDSQDQLQAVCDEHSAPGGLASGAAIQRLFQLSFYQ